MGSLIMTAAAVNFVPTPKGIGFLMFERVYANNVLPHTPHWTFVGAGYRSEVLHRVFELAASCQTWGIRSEVGPISPVDYVNRWVEAFDHATVLRYPDTHVWISTGHSRLHISVVDDFASLIDVLQVYPNLLRGEFPDVHPAILQQAFPYLVPADDDEREPMAFMVFRDRISEYPGLIDLGVRADDPSDFVRDYARCEIANPGHFASAYAEVNAVQTVVA